MPKITAKSAVFWTFKIVGHHEYAAKNGLVLLTGFFEKKSKAQILGSEKKKFQIGFSLKNFFGLFGPKTTQEMILGQF